MWRSPIAPELASLATGGEEAVGIVVLRQSHHQRGDPVGNQVLSQTPGGATSTAVDVGIEPEFQLRQPVVRLFLRGRGGETSDLDLCIPSTMRPFLSRCSHKHPCFWGVSSRSTKCTKLQLVVIADHSHPGSAPGPSFLPVVLRVSTASVHLRRFAATASNAPGFWKSNARRVQERP